MNEIWGSIILGIIVAFAINCPIYYIARRKTLQSQFELSQLSEQRMAIDIMREANNLTPEEREANLKEAMERIGEGMGEGVNVHIHKYVPYWYRRLQRGERICVGDFWLTRDGVLLRRENITWREKISYTHCPHFRIDKLKPLNRMDYEI